MNSEEILKELGYSDNNIDQLCRDGAVAQNAS